MIIFVCHYCGAKLRDEDSVSGHSCQEAEDAAQGCKHLNGRVAVFSAWGEDEGVDECYKCGTLMQRNLPHMKANA